MLPSITDVITRLQLEEEALGIALYSGASEAEIKSFEKAKGIKLPEAIKTFYRFCNGFMSDEDCFRIIPLQEIVANGRDNYLVKEQDFHIAEFLIYCDMWTLSIDGGNGAYYIYGDNTLPNVMPAASAFADGTTNELLTLTTSFAEFLDRFLAGGVYDGLYKWRHEIGRTSN